MNFTLPLLFILLSPGFLVSLGSKTKVSVMTILIHALIFTILVNVYWPELEGFHNCKLPTCANGATLKCSDNTGFGVFSDEPCPDSGCPRCSACPPPTVCPNPPTPPVCEACPEQWKCVIM